MVIAFLPGSKHLLISWLQSPSAVILEPKKIKSATVSTVSPSICHEVMGPDAMILVFWMLSFKPTFSLSSFPFIKGPGMQGMSIIWKELRFFFSMIGSYSKSWGREWHYLIYVFERPPWLQCGEDSTREKPEGQLDIQVRDEGADNCGVSEKWPDSGVFWRESR